MKSIYEILEFDKVKELFINYCKTELAKSFFNSLKKYDDYEELTSIFLDLKEGELIINKYGNFPLAKSNNILTYIKKAKKSYLLSEEELIAFTKDIKTINDLYLFFSKYQKECPRLYSDISSSFSLESLYLSILNIINNDLTIKDNASLKLKEIRNAIKKEEKELLKLSNNITNKYQEYLSDNNLFFKEGHLVLPVKTSLKNKVNGIIYALSDSGNTTFIEPLEMTRINNELSLLHFQENEEIRKILKELTSLILLQEKEISYNHYLIAKFDILNAKVLFMKNYSAVIPIINKEIVLNIKNAAHPLINKDKVVRNSYSLNQNKRIVIISGPNAGGKTVSLKTIGLLTLMALSGLPITSLEGSFYFFNNIFIDIGDHQSLADNLSTFSSHMETLSYILKNATKEDLVLLDELGTGTDPHEGASLSLGIIKYLEKKEILSFISSHFSLLKEYAFLSPFIENASLIFDEKSYSPTYIYKQGMPGKSYAISVAKRYALPEEILNYASNSIKKNNNESSELIDKLETKLQNISLLEERLKTKEENLSNLSSSLKEKEIAFKKREEDFTNSMELTKEELINKAIIKIKKIEKNLQKDKNKNYQKALDELEELKTKREDKIYNENIKINDYVYISSLDLKGSVTNIKGEKAFLITDFGFNIEINKNRLHKIKKEINEEIINKPLNKSTTYEGINRELSHELNLIGQNRDEALHSLINYISEAESLGYTFVKIIHGFGNGILRKMVHEYLSTLPNINFSLSKYNNGATDVDFKK